MARGVMAFGSVDGLPRKSAFSYCQWPSPTVRSFRAQLSLVDRTAWLNRPHARAHRFSTPDHVAHEYRILQLVEEAGIPAPRPLLLDAEGRLFDVPAMV